MQIYAHTGGPVDTNGYLVVDEVSRQAIVIDGGLLSGCNLTGVPPLA